MTWTRPRTKFRNRAGSTGRRGAPKTKAPKLRPRGAERLTILGWTTTIPISMGARSLFSLRNGIWIYIYYRGFLVLSLPGDLTDPVGGCVCGPPNMVTYSLQQILIFYRTVRLWFDI